MSVFILKHQAQDLAFELMQARISVREDQLKETSARYADWEQQVREAIENAIPSDTDEDGQELVELTRDAVDAADEFGYLG